MTDPQAPLEPEDPGTPQADSSFGGGRRRNPLVGLLVTLALIAVVIILAVVLLQPNR